MSTALTGHQNRSGSQRPTRLNIDGILMGAGRISGRSFLARNPTNVRSVSMVPPRCGSRERDPGALLNACSSLLREPHARARMNASLHTKISRGMSLSEALSSDVNGGLSSCHKTRFMSNLGRTRSFLGRSISKFRRQFRIMRLSEISGFV